MWRENNNTTVIYKKSYGCVVGDGWWHAYDNSFLRFNVREGKFLRQKLVGAEFNYNLVNFTHAGITMRFFLIYPCIKEEKSSNYVPWMSVDWSVILEVLI